MALNIFGEHFSTTQLTTVVNRIEDESIQNGRISWVDEDLLHVYYEELCIRVNEMEPEAVLWAIQRDMKRNFGDGKIRILCQN